MIGMSKCMLKDKVRFLHNGQRKVGIVELGYLIKGEKEYDIFCKDENRTIRIKDKDIIEVIF